MAYIELKNVKKSYFVGDLEIEAVKDISFEIDQGDFVVILGPSGAGKTTLLNLLGGMEFLDTGDIIVDEKLISQYSKKQISLYRRHDIGFVFQFYNLVQNLTALENVELATSISLKPFDPIDILTKVGLKDRLNNFPSKLSGGEQQRTAIARALAKNPKLLLCDEPTGALDSVTGRNILELLLSTNKEFSMTTILITHNEVISRLAKKVIIIKNGLVDEIIINENPLTVDEIDW